MFHILNFILEQLLLHEIKGIGTNREFTEHSNRTYNYLIRPLMPGTRCCANQSICQSFIHQQHFGTDPPKVLTTEVCAIQCTTTYFTVAKRTKVQDQWRSHDLVGLRGPSCFKSFTARHSYMYNRTVGPEQLVWPVRQVPDYFSKAIPLSNNLS